MNPTELLKKKDDEIITFTTEIKNENERKTLLESLIDELKKDASLLDRERFKPGPRLIEKLQKMLNELKSENETNNSNKSIDIEDLIWWKGSEGQLIYLFEQLVKNHLIDDTFDERKYVLLSMHFKNKKGKRFTNKQMSQAAQNLVMNKNRKPQKADLLETIAKTSTEVE